MASLIKIQTLSTPKSLKSFRNVTSQYDLDKILTDGQHERYLDHEILTPTSKPGRSETNAAATASSIASSRVPTPAEYKAIIHSAICPVEDILRKAPAILTAEARRIAIAAARQPPTSKLELYTGDKKSPPTEFRLKICDGCSHRMQVKTEEISAVLAEQEAAKEEFLRKLEKKHTRLEFGDALYLGFGGDSSSATGIVLPADADIARRFRRLLASPSALTECERRPSSTLLPLPAAERKQSFQYIGLHSKRNSSFRNLSRKWLTPELKKTMAYLRAGVIEYDWTWSPSPHEVDDVIYDYNGGSGNGTEPDFGFAMSRARRSQKFLRSADLLPSTPLQVQIQVAIVKGVPIPVEVPVSHSFTGCNWFGDVSLLDPGVKKAVFDLRGYRDTEIQLTCTEGVGIKLEIFTTREGNAGQHMRLNHVGSFFIPRPDSLDQYVFVRTPEGYLVIQKIPARRLRRTKSRDSHSKLWRDSEEMYQNLCGQAQNSNSNN